jgi:hypothetical protein
MNKLMKKLEGRGVRIGDGLSESDISRVSEFLRAKPPTIWIRLFSEFCPLGDGWPDWHSMTVDEAESLLRAPREMLELNILDGSWFPSWGSRPEDPFEALTRANSELAKVPSLLPMHGHRYLPCDREDRTGPVLSVMGVDTVFASADLVSWFDQEFSDDYFARSMQQPPVPFWGELASDALETIQMSALFR